MFLNFSDFEPRIILKLFLNTKGVNSPKNIRNLFQSFLVLYYIKNQARVCILYLKASESSIIPRIQKFVFLDVA